MKTLLLLIVICCGSEKEGTYVYEAKNLATNEVGKLIEYCYGYYVV